MEVVVNFRCASCSENSNVFGEGGCLVVEAVIFAIAKSTDAGVELARFVVKEEFEFETEASRSISRLCASKLCFCSAKTEPC